MLFFRSEERVAEWCQENRTPQRPLVSLPQLWELAVAWYSNRLSADAKRPSPAEMREIFTGIGLTGPFWDPEARG
jgi:hypothetical protein